MDVEGRGKKLIGFFSNKLRSDFFLLFPIVCKHSAINNYRWFYYLSGERFNLMENTSGLDLVVGVLAFAILAGGLVMLFVGMASFPKEK